MSHFCLSILTVLAQCKVTPVLCLIPQGDYDQSKTKVLHMTLNPTSVAKQRQREERDRLQEECERLRGLLLTLERSSSVPTDLEAVAGLPSSKEVAGRPPCPALASSGQVHSSFWAIGLSGLSLLALWPGVAHPLPWGLCKPG